MASRYPMRRAGTVPTMTELVCPKCESPMRSYERNGVTIDQCTGCRGLFLDRGELERLVDAEGSFYEEREERGASREEPARQEYREERDFRREQDYRKEPDFRQEHGGHRKPYKKRKKESFLSDFLDF
jgi:Zn-finger nucleic acid-binding protein